MPQLATLNGDFVTVPAGITQRDLDQEEAALIALGVELFSLAEKTLQTGAKLDQLTEGQPAITSASIRKLATIYAEWAADALNLTDAGERALMVGAVQ